MTSLCAVLFYILLLQVFYFWQVYVIILTLFLALTLFPTLALTLTFRLTAFGYTGAGAGGGGRLAGVLPKMIIFVSRKSDCDNIVDLLHHEVHTDILLAHTKFDSRPY